MKHVVTERKEIEDSYMTLEEVSIKTAKHREEKLALVVNNLGSDLLLSFLRNGKDGGKIFEISIRDGKISFERFAGRPSREVEDSQKLFVEKQPQAVWRNRISIDDKLERLEIPFEDGPPV